MLDFYQIEKEFYKLGINHSQYGNNLKYLDKYFGLNENLHNTDGLKQYGVDCLSLGNGEFILVYYQGSMSSKKTVRSRVDYFDKISIQATDKQKQAVYDFCLSIIEDRKKEIQINQERDFNIFVNQCLIFAKDWLSQNQSNYTASLQYGKSLAEKYPYDAIVIYGGLKRECDQIGRIKIKTNQYGDIFLGYWVCGCGGTEYKIDNFDTIKDDIVYACRWICN